jgi:phosphoenolpyruvate carboxykinase (GTP)
MGKHMTKPPKIFHVNWFRTDEKGAFLWPGFGENLRVLEWILDRCNGSVSAVRTPIGYVPRPQDIDLTGLELSPVALEKLLEVDPKDWKRELEDIRKFFRSFKSTLPKELCEEYKALEKRIAAGK